jgi:hypothetical protein
MSQQTDALIETVADVINRFTYAPDDSTGAGMVQLRKAMLVDLQKALGEAAFFRSPKVKAAMRRQID